MEIKVIAATIASFIASVVVAILNAAVADTSILGSLPGWLQWVIIIVAPTVVTFLGGYMQPSTTSSVSNKHVRQTND